MRCRSVLARSRIGYPSGLELPSCLYGLRLYSSSLSHWPGAEAASRPRTWPSWATTTHEAAPHQDRGRELGLDRHHLPEPARRRRRGDHRPPARRRKGKRYPAAVYTHPYRFSRALYYREAFDLAERGVAVLLVNAAMTRQDLAPVDLLDPVYAADAFRSYVRHDLVDLAARSTTSRGETTSTTGSPSSARSTAPCRPAVSRR